MERGRHSSCHRHSKNDSESQAVYCVITAMIYDIIIYTSIIPLIGTYLAGSCAKNFMLSPKWELFYTVTFTFLLLYAAFSVFGEAAFWRRIFLFDEFFCTLLQIRDVINTCLIIVCLLCLGSAIEVMVADREMKHQHVSEGAGYVFMKTLCSGLKLEKSFLLKFGLKLPHEGTLVDPNFGENERFEHGAAYMLYWAMLTASVAKLLYFNTLFTYMKSMKIFIALNPIFEHDGSSSLSVTSSNRTCTSRSKTR